MSEMQLPKDAAQNREAVLLNDDATVDMIFSVAGIKRATNQ